MATPTAAQQSAALDNVQAGAAPPSSGQQTEADTGKLGAAVGNLTLDANKAKPAAAATTTAAKPIKLDAADVAYLVEELEITKARAGELLRASGGDVMGAVRAYVVPA